MGILINSQIQIGRELKPFTEQEIKNEPMFFNSSYEHAFMCGGDPTRKFLLNLPGELQNNNTIIDSRVHMLMPGWYPCIPGYHHDDVERSRGDGQPNYDNPSYRSKHAMILYNGDICSTEFAVGEAEFTDPNNHKIVYKEWHEEVKSTLFYERLTKLSAPSNTLIFFDDRTWHQGTKAVKGGWRLFIRASWNTNRKATNEMRKQVQVYLENPMEGW